ncbi:MAG: DUF4080 domain-containing protein [Bacillota bacterium]|nr:DUF4080 domain-containing protein [Bacillota bacterium]
MKKTVICALNAKFIHSSLAIRYLTSFCKKNNISNISMLEFTINDLTDNIIPAIYEEHPDILCFSCYIWNIDMIHRIASSLKKVSPHTTIIFGGPEVSYDAEELLKHHPYIDCIIRGEGELTLLELIHAINEDRPWDSIEGISYQTSCVPLSTSDRPLIKELDIIPFPYENELASLEDKIVYYETNRGCPFNCSYCLSSTIKGVRFFSMDRVKKDLLTLMNHRVREIKFVDRSFNCNEKRAMQIMQFILEHKPQNTFHFEIEPDLLTDSMLEYLTTVPPDLFNFEIGIQSTFTPTLRAVNRRGVWEIIKPKIRFLRENTHIHTHLDLIAGLPFESFAQFKTSFNQLFLVHPHVIQLGFLKLLKGAAIREQPNEHAYLFEDLPPYQILQNQYMTYAELVQLERIADLLDRYYNSDLFQMSLTYIINSLYKEDAFAFWDDFVTFWNDKKLFALGHKRETLYTFLMQFTHIYHPDHINVLNELIKFDFLQKNHKTNLPDAIVSINPTNLNEQTYDLIKDESFIDQYLPEFIGKSHREVRKCVHMEYFTINPRDTTMNTDLQPIMFVYDKQKKTPRRIINLEPC